MYHMQDFMLDVNPCFTALILQLWSRNIYLLFYMIGSHEECSWLITWWMIVVGPEMMTNAELSLLATIDLNKHKSTQN